MSDPRRNQLKVRHGPGIWEDQAGGIHWSIPELLEVAELEDTPANRDEVIKMLEELYRKHCPNASIRHRLIAD